MFEARVDRFAAFLKTIDRYADDLSLIAENRPPEPRWDQVWFPRLDAAAAYVMVRETKSAHIVEIGAGHSTRFMARAIRDGGFATRLTTIDPEPRATIAGLAIEWLQARIQDIPPPALDPGDILFIDSSHVATEGGDVAYLMDRVLPALPAGALVHFHDIFLPDLYPPEWAARRYSEQDAVAALLAGGAYEVLFASRYVATRMPDALAASALARLPVLPGAFENSLWLRKSQSA